MTAERVLGVDACPGGWIAILLDRRGATGRFAPSLVELVELVGLAAGELSVIAIDIPIGLPDAGVRDADVMARAAVGPRRSSVFLTPVRAAVRAATFDEANAVTRRLTGHGLSRQSFALATRILEADEFVAHRRGPVIEVHPELCFATMGGGVLGHSKKTWLGAELRRELLRENGIRLDTIGSSVGSAGVDDVLDAAAAAWTARRYGSGTATSIPVDPQFFSDGIAASIWV